MRAFRLATASLGSFVLFLLSAPVFASWAPTTIVRDVSSVPRVVSDGSTGSIAAWTDTRGGAPAIYVQHLGSSDAVDPAWPANGLFVGATDQSCAIVADGAGGAIIGMVDNDGTELRAYHVQASGALDPAWPATGVLVTNTPCRPDPVAVLDGAGGAIFAWTDSRNIQTTGDDLYAQRVRSTGVVDPAWPSNGLAVCTAVDNQEGKVATSDGSGGMILAWQDIRNGIDDDIFAQRIVPTGAISIGWPANGRQLTAAAEGQADPVICSDGAGGAIVAWADERNADTDIYAMRVRSTGALANGWHSDGEAICTATLSQRPFDMVADGAGGAVISWFDPRSSDNTTDIYVQKITGSSSTPWTTNGVAICTAPNYQVSPSLASDGSGGVFVAWQDRRFETSNFETELFVDHVVSTGSPDPAWPSNGGRVTYDGMMAFGGNYTEPMVVNGAGIATVFWSGDPSKSNASVYALQMTTTFTSLFPLVTAATPAAAGTVAKNPDRISYPSGAIVSLTAVPNSGHTFIAWSGDASGSANPVNVTMSASHSVTAIFDGYAVNTSVAPSGTGTVSKSPDQALYTPGTHVTLTANPAGGYMFVNWTGDASGSSNPLDFVVSGPANVTANFTLAPPSCGNWSLVTSAHNPSARVGPAMVWDPVRHRALMFGGYDGTNYLNDVWQFTLASGWSQITPAGVAPSPRDAAGLLYDPVRDRLLIIYGNNANSPLPTDVFALSLSGTPTWSQLSPTGPGPSGRFGFSTIYDPVRDRVIFFGGFIGLNSGNLNDTWALSLAGTPAWAQLSPGGPVPPGRFEHAAVYDPVRDRMMVLGGAIQFTFGLNVYNDLWFLSLGGSPTWTQFLVPGPKRYECGGIYDPLRDRMIIVGGLTESLMDDLLGVYSFSMPVQPFWDRLPVGGVNFGFRRFHAMVRDPDSDVLLVFAGQDSTGPMTNDTKRLDCAGGEWLEAGGDHGTVNRYPAKACYGSGETVTLQAVGNFNYALQQWLGDASGNNPLIDVTMNSNKTIFAQFVTGSVGVGETPLSFALEEIHPNPNPGPVQITYTLPRAARVKLGVYDLAGRLVGRIADGMVEAGRHMSTWDGQTRHGAVTSGIYFIRYETPAGTWSRRLALLR